MLPEHPLADEAETEIGTLKEAARSAGWKEPDVAALFDAFDRWLQHPRLLDPDDESLLRVRVLNELTFLLADPALGDRAWEHIRGIARSLGREDVYGMRESWRIATFELAAEPPEDAEFLGRLFSLAGDEETRWAVFAAYEHFPWRLRPHAHKYSKGLISDQDCDEWFIDQGRGDDEILMRRTVIPPHAEP